MTQQYIVEQYVFNPAARTITLPSIPDAKIEGVQLVTNLTTGTLIYQFNNVSLGGTMSSNVLTLTFDTTSMAATDKLQILYNPPTGGFYDRAMALLYQIVEHLRSPQNSVQLLTGTYQRALLDNSSSINSVANVATVNAVTSMNQFNGIDARELIWNLWDTEYNTGIRSKII